MTAVGRLLGIMLAWLIVELWQRRFGAWFNRKAGIVCRFYPTCSEYAVQTLRRDGAARGALLAIQRVRRCVPENCDSCFDPP